MSDDIRVKVSLIRHPKWRRLGKAVGAEGQVALLALWLLTREVAHKDGVLECMDACEIEHQIGWFGAPGACVKALTDTGWLHHDGANYVVHAWTEHQAWAVNAERRSEVATANAARGWESRRGGKKGRGKGRKQKPDANTNADGNASGNADAKADGNAPLPSSPLPSPPLQRREGGREGSTRCAGELRPAGSPAARVADLCSDCKTNPREPTRGLCLECLQPKQPADATEFAAIINRLPGRSGRTA